MEIFKSCVVRKPGSDEEVDYTALLLSKDGAYFYATVHTEVRPHTAPESLGLNPQTFVEVPLDDVFPAVTDRHLRAPEPLPHNCLVKTPNYFYHDGARPRTLASQMLWEMELWTGLAFSGVCPSLATYRGAVVQDGKIIGLCFDRRGFTLEEEMKKHTFKRIDGDKVLEATQRAFREATLHMLEIGYWPLQSSNNDVMFDGEKATVVDISAFRPVDEAMPSRV